LLRNNKLPSCKFSVECSRQGGWHRHAGAPGQGTLEGLDEFRKIPGPKPQGVASLISAQKHQWRAHYQANHKKKIFSEGGFSLRRGAGLAGAGLIEPDQGIPPEMVFRTAHMTRPPGQKVTQLGENTHPGRAGPKVLQWDDVTGHCRRNSAFIGRKGAGGFLQC